MAKTQKHLQQLELPVLANVNANSKVSSAISAPESKEGGTRSHKSASADDQSVYQSIRDRYFGASADKV